MSVYNIGLLEVHYLMRILNVILYAIKTFTSNIIYIYIYIMWLNAVYNFVDRFLSTISTVLIVFK